jgi:thioredoxin 1
MKQLIYFSANWCAACQSMKPAIDQIAKSGIQVAKIDTDYDVSLTEQYKVKSIPTVVMLENGQEIKRYSGGALTESQLKNFING